MTGLDGAGRVRRIWKLFMSFWRERRTTLHSPRSPDQCTAALKQDLAGWPFGGEGSVRGRVARRRAVLARRIPYGNSFRDLVTVHISDSGSGTRLVCVTAAGPFVRAFMVVWFAFLAFWWLAVIAIAITEVSAMAALMALFPLPMLAFGVGLIVFGRQLSEKDERVVLAYLRERLEAS